MRASDHGCVFEFPGTALEHSGEPFQTGGNDGGGLGDQEGLRGVHHIVGSQSIVEPARVRTHDFGHRGGKGDHVVADFGFDLGDAAEIEICPLADGARRLRGHHTGLRQGVGGGHLHRQPGAEAVLLAPDAAHLGAGVA